MSRDTKDAATRIALVPEQDEIDWRVSADATHVLEHGTLSFETDEPEARWVRQHRGNRWYAMGDGRAVFARTSLLASTDVDRTGPRPPYLRVGEALYRTTIVQPSLLRDDELIELQLIDVCADVETIAQETDEQWDRVPPGFWGPAEP